ncbi:MAG: M14 family metallopeptidase [Bacteroidales bacterium]|nr:M14 family metallopeptidase [Bacteroidales bacterium]
MKKSFILVFAISIIATTFTSAQDAGLTLRFDHYYDYGQLVEAMQKLHQAYPGLTALDLVGYSEEDRAIYALTISNPKTGDHLSKPGVYVDGNIHGNEVQAGEVCLYLANRLLSLYGSNEQITSLVDKNSFYIIPAVNVDGRYHFFEDANTSSSSRSLLRPKDDDRDGLFDEDPNDDLDGDGNICDMRKRDPNGTHRTDPYDSRLMVRVKPGEKGEWILLGREGIDNDGDGRINEDTEGYVDPNRNWGYNWAPNYVQRGAGYYPLSGTGLKAIADYLLNRPNVIMVWAFHNSGGMFLRGPSTQEEGEFPQGDLRVYDYLGKNSEMITPGYQYLLVWKDLYSTYGDFTGFTTNIIGSYGFVGELYQSSAETYALNEKLKKPGERSREEGAEDSNHQRLQFNDHVVQGELFKPWTPFNHPVYGEIEIGGWTKMSSRLPHPFMLQDLVHRNASAVIFTAAQTPEIKAELIEKKEIGKNLYQVRIRLINNHAIPTLTYQSLKNKSHRQDILKVSGPSIQVVAGGKLLDAHLNQSEYKEHKPQIQFIQIPGFGKVEYQFLISGKGSVVVDYSSLKARDQQLEFNL